MQAPHPPAPPPDMQDTELTAEAGPTPMAGGPTPLAGGPHLPPATPPAGDQVEQQAGEEEGRDQEEATAHHSSGYASSDSSGVGGGQAATTPLSEAAAPITPLAQPAALPLSIQSDPQQSAFRPALPAQQVRTILYMV